MHHWEADQEDFLVLSGEALLIVGAGDGPCAVLAIGAREHQASGP